MTDEADGPAFPSNGVDKARASKAGHAFHEAWAARSALELLPPGADLAAITLEGFAVLDELDLSTGAVEIADLVRYYGRPKSLAAMANDPALDDDLALALCARNGAPATEGSHATPRAKIQTAETSLSRGRRDLSREAADLAGRVAAAIADATKLGLEIVVTPHSGTQTDGRSLSGPCFHEEN